MKESNIQSVKEWAESLDKDAVKIYIDQHREEIMQGNILIETYAFHSSVHRRYKKELDILAQKIKMELMGGSKDEGIKNLDVTLDFTVIAKKKP